MSLKKKVFVYPCFSSVNPYIQRNIDLISSIKQVEAKGLPSLKEFVKRPVAYYRSNKCDYLIVNWLENFLRNKNGRISLKGLLLYISHLVIFSFLSKRLIYVRHNLFPHGMRGYHASIAKSIIEFSASLCHKRVAHSGHLADYEYVPHPLYSLEKIPDIDIDGFGLKAPYFLMFGRISPYKGIDNVISTWERPEKLVILGQSLDGTYLDSLLEFAKGKNVVVINLFVEDSVAKKVFEKAEGIILAHAEKETIVSGSFYYAASLGTPVYAIETPFFTWLIDNNSLDFLAVKKSLKDIDRALGCIDANERAKEKFKQQAKNIFGDKALVSHWEKILEVGN